jgi:hypothetical protein
MGTPTRLFALSNLMLKEAICCALVCTRHMKAARKKGMIFFMAKIYRNKANELLDCSCRCRKALNVEL